MLRNIGATLAGIAVAVILVGIVESIGHVVFPPPEDIDLNDPAALAKLIAELPGGALVFVVIGWACGAFMGGLVAMKAARGATRIPSVLVGIVLLAATGWTLYAIPHPLWMTIAGIIVPLPLALFGASFAGKPPAAPE